MAGAIVSFTFNGLVYVIDTATDTLKTLRNTSTLTTTGLTLHDLETNADYQVPAGKTFTILGFEYSTSNTSRTISVFQADAADGTTGEVDKLVFTTAIDVVYRIRQASPDLPVVAAEKYVNVKVNNVTSTPAFDYVVGVEA